MSGYLTKSYLRRLRNEIPIVDLIADYLEVPHKMSEGRFRFQCPLCKDLNTATNPKTNLGRCFDCKRNFNPIDITMLTKKTAFLDAIDYLEPLLPSADKQDLSYSK